MRKPTLKSPLTLLDYASSIKDAKSSVQRVIDLLTSPLPVPSYSAPCGKCPGHFVCQEPLFHSRDRAP